MAKKYLDYDGLLYFWQKIKTVFVPTTRKVNGKALSADITLSASDVSALPSSTTIPSPGTGSSYPAMDGTRALGSNAGYARVDHVHPTDSTRAPLASPTFTGTPTAPTPSSGDDSTKIATTEFVLDEIDDALGSLNVGVTDVKIDSSSIVTQGIANIPTASTSAKGLMTTAQVTKLNGIETGAEVNQNAFGGITVDIGGTPLTIAATEESDEITFVAGSNVMLTPDDTNKTLTITATNTTYSVVTAGTSTTSGGLMSQADKTKLDGVASGAEVNQNAFSNVKVGSTTVAADTKTDTLELAAGSNITLTPDATNDKVTIAFSGTIPTVPNNFGTVKVGSTNVVADTTSDTLELVAGSNVTLTPDATNDKVTIAATDTTYESKSAASGGTAVSLVTTGEKYTWNNKAGTSTATTSANGLMSSTDKTKLDGIASGAEVNQNAFSTLKCAKNSGATVKTAATAASKTSDFIIQGNGAIEVTDCINNSISGVQVSILSATSSRNGYMSSTDKAKLDSLIMTNGVIDASNLPSYVDDVIEAYARSGQTALSSTWLATGSASGTVITPEAGKIYVLMADSGDYAANTQFRWGGSAYVKMADGGVSSITNAEIDTIVAS